MDINSLFSSLCDIVFTLEDGSQLLCRTTLNNDILAEYSYENIDGFVDILVGKIIPEELFTYPFSIASPGTVSLSGLDLFFQDGGKLHWKNAR